MDIKQNVPPTGGTTSQQKKSNEEFLTSHLLVRTMEKDMAALSKNSQLVSLSPKGIPLTKPAASQPFLPPKIVAPSAMDATKKIIPPLDLPVAKDENKPVAPTIPLTPKPAPPPPPSPPSLSTPAPAPKSPAQKPLPPLPTLPVLPTTTLPEPGRKMAWGKIALIAGLLIIISLGVGGWIYWQNFQPGPTTSATPSSTPSATPTPLVLPSPLFSMDGQKIIDEGDEKYNSAILKTDILSAYQETAPAAATFLHLLFKVGTADEPKFENLESLMANFGIDFFNSPIAAQCPADASCSDTVVLKDLFERQELAIPFSLFAYSQAQNSSPFSGGTGEPRLGLIIKLRSTVTAEVARQAVKDLEFSLPKSLKPFFLDKDVQISENPKFLDNTYKEIPIRYINFPTAALSIDYALVNDMLVVATSKESMYAAIDRILTASAATTKGDLALSEVEGWQTYRNDEYGFEVKYPVGIKIQEQGNDFVKIGTNYPFNYGLTDAYEIGIYTGIKGDDFGHEAAGPKQKTEDITVVAINAVKTTWRQNNNKEIDIDLDRGNFSFQIRFTTVNGDKYDEVFDQILSTFKFIPR